MATQKHCERKKMVVNTPPDYEEKRKLQAKIDEGELSKRKRLLEQFADFSSSLILLAFMYAKNFEETGEDITKRWGTAVQQSEALQKCYEKGYNEGFRAGVEKGAEHEKKKVESLVKKQVDMQNEKNYAVIFSDSDSNRELGENIISRAHGNVVQPAHAKSHSKYTKKRRKR